MKTILLTDDDDLFGDTIQKAITLFGYAVIRARNGKEALQLYTPESVALVLEQRGHVVRFVAEPHEIVTILVT